MNMKNKRAEQIKKIFTQNLREKLLAVLCAAAVMLAAFCLKPVYENVTVKIETKIAENQLLISKVPDTSVVKIYGNFFELRKLEKCDFVMKVDFSENEAGNIVKQLDDSMLPDCFNGIKAESFSPHNIVLHTEKKVEKKVAVKVVFDKESPVNPNDFKVEPTEIKIIGAANVLENMNEIKSETVSKNLFETESEAEVSLVYPEFTMVSEEGSGKVKITKIAESSVQNKEESGEIQTEKEESEAEK